MCQYAVLVVSFPGEHKCAWLVTELIWDWLFTLLQTTKTAVAYIHQYFEQGITAGLKDFGSEF